MSWSAEVTHAGGREELRLWEWMVQSVIKRVLPTAQQVASRYQSDPDYDRVSVMTTHETLEEWSDMSWKSGAPARNALESRRNDGVLSAEPFNLWYRAWQDAETGEYLGIQWTALPEIGQAWNDEYSERRRLKALQRSERRWVDDVLRLRPSAKGPIQKLLQTIRQEHALLNQIRMKRRLILGLELGGLDRYLPPIEEDEGIAAD